MLVLLKMNVPAALGSVGAILLAIVFLFVGASRTSDAESEENQ